MATPSATLADVEKIMEFTTEYWKQYAASGRKRVTYVGISRQVAKPARIKSVSTAGVRILFAGDIEPVRVHPEDITPA